MGRGKLIESLLGGMGVTRDDGVVAGLVLGLSVWDWRYVMLLG
jgi:hypothetical protein